MKKHLLYSALVLCLGVTLTGCDEFLNDNRYPLDKQTSSPEFWSNSVNVEGEANHFYNNVVGYGSGTNGTFYYHTLSDDQAGAISSTFANWAYTTTPSESDDWDDPYIEIRRANLLLEGVASGSLNNTTAGNNFMAIARLDRGMQYLTLVKKFGDVPLVEKPLDVNDQSVLFGPRTNRNEVIDFALADLNFAIENLTTESSKTTFSRDYARAMKIELCLFEGTYAKYVLKDSERSKKYLNEVVNVATVLMPKYSIGDDYAALYNSMSEELNANSEVIMMKAYKQDVMMHSLLDWTCSSSTVCGITRNAFDSFLFLDGQTADKTSYDNTDKGEPIENGLSIANILSVRDKRLSAIVWDRVIYPNMSIKFENTMPISSHTGYGVKKFYTDEIPYDYTPFANKNYTAAPIYWGARVALALVEAKAELGTLQNSDLTNTLDKLYSRAGLPTKTVDELAAMNAADNNMGVSSLIFEIRRCRRCELMLDDDVRYWDLVRWNKLDLLDFTKNPTINQGAYVADAPIALPAPYVMQNGYMVTAANNTRTFDAKYNLYPIPSQQRLLNPNLKQNHGWE